jgi:hypothetical protein
VDVAGFVEALLRIVPAVVTAARELIPGGGMLDELDSVRRVAARLDELERQRAANPPDLALLAASDEDVLLAVHGSMEVMSVLLAAVIERRAADRRCEDVTHEHGPLSLPGPRRRAARLPRGPGGSREDP